MKHFKKYFAVFFSKLVLFMKRRNKISFEVKKKKIDFVCCSAMIGCMMSNYEKMIQGQNSNRKRRNKTTRIKPAGILSKERRKSV